MSKVEKSTKMMALLNYRLRVTIRDGRLMIGQLLAFDRHMNLVLAECEEFRKITIKAAKEGERREREEKRVLGLVILRGDLIVNFTIESPPPGPKQDKKPGLGMPVPGPGLARPAGRGLPIVAPPSVPVPGLVGPGRMGGPASVPSAPGMIPPGFPPTGAFPGPPGPPGGLPPMPPGWRPGMPLPPMPPGFRPPPGFPTGLPPRPPQ